MKKLSLIFSLLFSSLALFSQTSFGTKTADPSAMLELKSVNKGFLSTRVQLSGVTDKVTIPAPATGLIVYHTGITGMDAGVYVNVGTAGSPSWSKGATPPVNEPQGTRIYKVKYQGRNIDTEGFPKPTLKITELNLEFRFAVNGGINNFQTRLLNAPSQTVNIKSTSHWHGASHGSGNNTYTFTPANYNIWQGIDGNWSGWWSYFYYFTTDESSYSNSAINLYGICSYGNQGAAITKEQYVLSGKVF